MEHEQGILFKEPTKEITPDISRKAPFLWIKELRFYEELIKDKEPIRQIKLRPGLNILWAKPADKEEVKLRESGIAGHSAGKTLFCRLVRYILGESTFAKSTIQKDIRNKFINSAVVAEVILDNTHWLVIRPLGLAEKHYAVRNCTIEQIFNNNLQRVSYKFFKDELNKRVTDRLPLKYFPSSEEPITWDHILPWLSRDQESHLEHIAKWRNSRSESDAINPDTTTNCYIIRGVLGCITDEEQSLIKQNEVVKVQKNNFDKQQPLDNFYFKRLKETLPEEIFPSDFQLASDLNNILEQKIDDEINRYKNLYQKSLLELEAPEQENPTINLIQLNLKNIRESIEQKKIEIKQSKGYLALDFNELKVLCKGAPSAIDKPFSWSNMNKAAAPGRCNVPLAEAIRKGCVLARGNTVDFESSKNLLEETNEKTKIYKEDIANLRSKIRKLNKELKDLQKHEHDIQEQYNIESKKANLGKNELAKKLSEYSNAITRLEELLNAFKTKVKTEESFKKAEQENISLNKYLLEIRKKNNDKESNLNSIYKKLMQDVLEPNLITKITPKAKTIDLDVEYHGLLDSEAVNVAKIMGFDIAALIMGIEETNGHPGFLLHDSPRESDMSKDIYQKFFLFVKEEMEDKYPEKMQPTFQYIVTTTEPPPKALQQAPWLIEPTLDASIPVGRLLKTDL